VNTMKRKRGRPRKYGPDGSMTLQVLIVPDSGPLRLNMT
jgi:hypothetical protein